MSEEFEIYPAIDLRRGQVVRLMQGDPHRQTTYGDDPSGVASRWAALGARWLHVVNLDGAFGETGGENLDALQAILDATAKLHPSVKIQFGGGLRSLEDIERVLNSGVNRVMLGSMAAENPDFAARALRRFSPECVALAMDVYAGAVRVRGWTETASIDPVQLGRQLYDQGLRTCAYTDVRRDGGGSGLNLEATRSFARETGLAVIASGGVGAIDDVIMARQAGLSGVIIGRALYEGQVDLKEALAC